MPRPLIALAAACAVGALPQLTRAATSGELLAPQPLATASAFQHGFSMRRVKADARSGMPDRVTLFGPDVPQRWRSRLNRSDARRLGGERFEFR